MAFKWIVCNKTDDVGKGGVTGSTHPLYLCNDAAELRSILGEGQQVADGTADGLDVVRGLNLLDQDLQHVKRKKMQ